MIRIEERLPTADEYNALRADAGWGTCDRELARRWLPGSLYGVCAVDGSATVGMARVIGDGGLAFYIQDVVVAGPYQRRGIGKRLMERVMAFVATRAAAGAVVGLMSAAGKEAFYEPFGFVRRPTERFGCGMTLFWPPR
jgi:GNAT superfamily N-acetyltransferase